jgi:hypothetical protein
MSIYRKLKEARVKAFDFCMGHNFPADTCIATLNATPNGQIEIVYNILLKDRRKGVVNITSLSLDDIEQRIAYG